MVRLNGEMGKLNMAPITRRHFVRQTAFAAALYAGTRLGRLVNRVRLFDADEQNAAPLDAAYDPEARFQDYRPRNHAGGPPGMNRRAWSSTVHSTCARLLIVRCARCARCRAGSRFCPDPEFAARGAWREAIAGPGTGCAMAAW